MAKVGKVKKMKWGRILLGFLFLCSQAVSVPKSSGVTISFPLLPTDGYSYGGEIDIDDLKPEQISSIVGVNEKAMLDRQIGNCTRYVGNGRYIVRFGSSGFGSLSGMNSVLMEGIGINANPVMLLSRDSIYLAKTEIVAHRNGKGNLDLYDVSTEKLAFTITGENPKSIEDVSSDKILVGYGESYDLYDTKCWSKILTCDSRHAWNESVFATTEKIVCLDDNCKVVDISMYNINSKPVVDGRLIYFALPDKAGGKFFILSTISCSGSLDKVDKIPFLYPMDGFELIGIRDGCALIKSGPWPKTKWTVFTIPQAQLKWEVAESPENPIECRFIDGKLVQKSKVGLVVYELSKLKEPIKMDFPEQAEFLTEGKTTYVAMSETGDDGKPVKSIYELTDSNQILKASRTILPISSKGVYLHKGEFMSVDYETLKNEDGFIVANRYRFSSYLPKSDKFYKAQELVISTECKEYPGTCVIDGQFFVQTSSGIEMYNLYDRMKKIDLKLGGWYSTAVTPKFFVRGNRLFVDLPKDPDMDSSKKTLFCFDLLTGKQLIRQTLKDEARVVQVEQDYVLVRDSSDSDFTVIKVIGSQVQKKESLAILGNQLFFRKSEKAGDKTKMMLGKMNLNDGSQQFYETSCTLESPSMFLDRNIYSSCSGFVSEYGRHIQSPLGCYKFFSYNQSGASIIEWSKERNNGEVFGLGGSNTIARLAPCPTFGLARRSMNQFELTMTRQDELCENLSGRVSAVYWPDDGGMPPFVKMSSVIIDSVKPGQTIVLNVDKNKISTVLGERTLNMALIFDTNGLLDTLHSDSTFFANPSPPLFEGAPICIGRQRALSIAVYKRLINNH